MRICKDLNLSKVLMGDTAGQLAIRLISFVSQGRGGQLSYEMVCLNFPIRFNCKMY